MAQLQHYVPQSALRRFCDENGRLWVLDKKHRRTFRTNPRNVAAEAGFYDFETAGGSASLEGPLARLEGITAPLIDRIIERQEIGFLSPEEHHTIAAFAAVQLVRIPGHRERFRHLSKGLVEKLRSIIPTGADPASLPDLEDEEEAKRSSMRLIVESIGELTPHFLNKAWMLMESPRDRPMWISDSPVTLHNSKPPPAPFMGNLGLAVRGIEIYLPISTRFCIGFICPSIAGSMMETHEMAQLLRHEANTSVPNADLIGYLADGLRYGHPVPTRPENMDLFNSLQVSGSERWVFGPSDDFGLAEAMLKKHPSVATGPRFKIG